MAHCCIYSLQAFYIDACDRVAHTTLLCFITKRLSNQSCRVGKHTSSNTIDNDASSSMSEPAPTLDSLAAQPLMPTSDATDVTTDAQQNVSEMHAAALDDNEQMQQQQQSPLASTAAAPTVVDVEAMEAEDPNETEDEEDFDDHHMDRAFDAPHTEHADAHKISDADANATSGNAITTTNDAHGDAQDPAAADESLGESEATDHSHKAVDSSAVDQVVTGDGVEVSDASEPAVDAAVDATTDAAGDVDMADSVNPEPSAPEAMAVDADDSTATNEETAPADASSEAPAHADVPMNESEQPTHDDAADAHASPLEQNPHESSEHAASSSDSAEHAHESHAHDEYDPSAPYEERHERDEYDPAHPSYSVEYGEEEYDPENPAYEPGEYNPSDPSYESALHDVPADATESETSAAGTKRAASTAEDDADAIESGEIPSSPSSQSHSERDAKRQRTDRRAESSSPRSVDSRDKRTEDKKGLADAAWDRLMDFATLGEFEINQVSRAAFASVGALPEFAQVSIIARFTRVPMRGVRDKNGQLMRIHHEYLKENPHVAALKRVETFMPDASTDAGLYAFGYAPPQPVTGMSTAPVPYQKDLPARRQAPKTSSPRAQRSAPATPASAAPAAPQADVDEFGRSINKSAPAPATEATDRAQRPTDPRRASAADMAATPASRVNGASATGKAFDPRRRATGDSSGPVTPAQDPRRVRPADAAPTPVPAVAPVVTPATAPAVALAPVVAQATAAAVAPAPVATPAQAPAPVSAAPASVPVAAPAPVAAPTQVSAPVPAPVAAPTPVAPAVPHAQPVDPRRRTAAAAASALPAPVAPAASGDELYAQLPASVRAVLDEMIAEGSLRERISDAAVSRLTQVPERVARTAVENFSNVDLSLIDSPEVFLLGIVKRVHDKALAADRAAAAAQAPQALDQV